MDVLTNRIQVVGKINEMAANSVLNIGAAEARINAIEKSANGLDGNLRSLGGKAASAEEDLEEVRTRTRKAEKEYELEIDQLRRMREFLTKKIADADANAALLTGLKDILREYKEAKVSFTATLVIKMKADPVLRDAVLDRLIEPMQAGTIVAYPAAERIPDGWRVCDGSLMDPNTFDELFLRIGYTYGRDGRRFKLPDYRGVFLRGVDDPNTSDGKPGPGNDPDASRRYVIRNKKKEAVGGIVGSKQDGATKLTSSMKVGETGSAHKHEFDAPQSAGRGWHVKPGTSETNSAAGYYTRVDGAHPHPLVGGDKETRPVNVAVNWIVKVK